MLRAIKIRLYPNKTQTEQFNKLLGCYRFVYNQCLARKINSYRETGTTENRSSLGKFIHHELLKNDDFVWLREQNTKVLKQAVNDMLTAYKNFFERHTGYPKFKSKKNRYKSYRTSYMKTSAGGNIMFIDKHIKLPKLGLVKVRDKQIPQGRILNATISQEPNGHYYCSLCCTDVEFEQLPKTNKNVGIDLGICDFAILSDGIKIENPQFYEQSEKKLAKLQRELSRKTIGSARWEKTRLKVAKLQKHIANQRNDFLQKLTTTIISNYDVISIEDLDVESMKETDSKIRNKRVGDVSWSEFRRMLTYKSQWYGKELSVIDRYYPSSQICHVCGHRDGKKSEDIRNWICPHCNSKLDRDINAAINILNEGLRLLNV